MKKKRLDILMVDHGLVESRNIAQRLIMAGEVLVDGQLAHKPSQTFLIGNKITLKNKPEFVSRGGIKLAHGLKYFNLVHLSGFTCVDIGASTGGFTDCLLKHDATLVYAVDVGYGQLHIKLRNNPQVVVMERTNVRKIERFKNPLDLVTIDASFISLRQILPVVKKWADKKGFKVIALVKPQFEAGRKAAAKGKGVIRDPSIRQSILDKIVLFAETEGFCFHDVTESPIRGPKGNLEYLIYLSIEGLKEPN